MSSVQEVAEAFGRFSAEFPARSDRMLRSILLLLAEATARKRAVQAASGVVSDGCKVCAHPQRSKLDRALVVGGQTPRGVAKTYAGFGLLRRHLERHRDKCLVDAISRSVSDNGDE